MKPENKAYYFNPIFIAQLVSLTLIWVMVTGIAFWIANLIDLSIDLKDAIGASIGISIVAIPIFFALAGLLTFVFIGLHKEVKRLFKQNGEEK